jgi:hypothetical protein
MVMRIVSCPISKLGLVVGDVVNVVLLNSVGTPLLSRRGFSMSSNVAIDSDILSLELLENDLIEQQSHYKLTLPNGLAFNFTIESTLTETIPHDLIYLLHAGCYYGIVKDTNGDVELDEKFLSKLDIYFSGENPFFTKTEQELVDLFIYYADEIKNSGSTIDLVKKIDAYLSTLGV